MCSGMNTGNLKPVNALNYEKKCNKPESNTYSRIKRIRLDNEISLVMQSPPPNPGWGSNEIPGSNRDPFKPEDYYG